MSLSKAERETIISLSDADDVAYVYTAQRRIITKLKANPSARLIEEGVFDGTAWTRFEILNALISFRSQVRRGRALTEAEKDAAALRLAKARSHRPPGGPPRSETQRRRCESEIAAPR